MPRAATIYMDDDGASSGWFFDPTPTDDVEFTGIVGPYQANFIDATTLGQQHQNDFYRTIAHEIGHALGISINSNLRISNYLLPFDSNNDTQYERDTSPLGNNDVLLGFHHPNSSAITSLTPVGGGHIYEGGSSDAPETPVHAFDLMNSGRTTPAGLPNPTPPIETTRKFISDLNVRLLADAYGYSVVLPSTLNTAHAMLDVWTGTLLVQGGARDNSTGTGVNDTIHLQRVTDSAGDDIQVTVSYGGKTFTERVPFADVTNIVVHGNGGTDSITVNSSVSATKPWQEVQYVVSSNEDALETSSTIGEGSLVDGIVDLSSIIPGSQTTLRAAVRAHGNIRFDSPCSMFRIAA